MFSFVFCGFVELELASRGPAERDLAIACAILRLAAAAGNCWARTERRERFSLVVLDVEGSSVREQSEFLNGLFVFGGA